VFGNFVHRGGRFQWGQEEPNRLHRTARGNPKPCRPRHWDRAKTGRRDRMNGNSRIPALCVSRTAPARYHGGERAAVHSSRIANSIAPMQAPCRHPRIQQRHPGYDDKHEVIPVRIERPKHVRRRGSDTSCPADRRHKDSIPSSYALPSSRLCWSAHDGRAKPRKACAMPFGT